MSGHEEHAFDEMAKRQAREGVVLTRQGLSEPFDRVKLDMTREGQVNIGGYETSPEIRESLDRFWAEKLREPHHIDTTPISETEQALQEYELAGSPDRNLDLTRPHKPELDDQGQVIMVLKDAPKPGGTG